MGKKRPVFKSGLGRRKWEFFGVFPRILVVVESQVLHRPALVDELFEGVDADFEVLESVVLGHHFVRFFSFDAVRKHRLVGDEQQRTGGDAVVEAH